MQAKPTRLFLSSFVILTVLFNLQSAFAQQKAERLADSVRTLESNIHIKLLFNEIQLKLESIKKQSVELKDNILQARILYDLMRIRDQRTEDTLYFRNSAFMDTLLGNPATPEKLKAILYVMRAKRVGSFSKRYTRFNRGAYKTHSLKTDYATFTDKQRDSLAVSDLQAALDIKADLDAEELMWLSSNPGIFLFKPTFADIVSLEKINLFARHIDDDRTQYSELKSWLSLSPAAFKAKLNNLSGITQPDALYGYRDWIAMHQSSPEIASFIESLAHKYLYLSLYPDTATRASYAQYLTQIIGSPYPATQAHAVYQQCLLWNQDGKNYANVIYSGLFQVFKTYQYYPAKAFRLYTEHVNLMHKYPVFDRPLKVMLAQIKFQGLRMTMDKEFLPGKDIPVTLVYKNTDTLYYRILKVAFDGPMSNRTKLPATEKLLNTPTVDRGAFALPLPADYNRHSVYLKLKALPVGHYRVLFNYVPMKAGGDDLNCISFNVTGIAPVNSDEKLFVLDRQTGFPLPGAEVITYNRKNPATWLNKYAVNKDGFADLKGDFADSAIIAFKGDTTDYNINIRDYHLPDRIYDKEKDDKLDDFYEDKLRMEIFTDRSIYRPGQSVQYKVIFLTNNALTGEAIPFSRENIGAGIFDTMIKKWQLEKTDKLKLKDPFGKIIDSASIKINDFGSFSGTFSLPKSAATGDWRLDAAPETNYENSGEFKVEEYKRPGIELTMERPKKMLRPGDPFIVRLRLRSFSGASLNNIPIKYTVNRSGYLPKKENKPRDYMSDFTHTDIISQTGYTDNEGKLEIAVNDSTLANLKLADSVAWNFTYTFQGTAVDASGESTDLNESFEVSSRPIAINIPIENKGNYDRQTFPILNVTTTNSFEGQLGKKVNIKLYRIDREATIGNSYGYVDQWYYKQSDWNNWFPDKAMLPAVTELKTLVLDTMINTAVFEKLRLPENILKAAAYRLVAEVTENNSVIGQSSCNFNIFDSKTGSSPTAELDYMPLNMVKNGDTLTWFNSCDTNSYAIYQILYISGKHKRVVRNIYQFVNQKTGIYKWQYKVPGDVTNGLTVSRIIVKNNNIHQSQKTVYISDLSKDPLNIIVEKYRRVMEPGAREKFTVSVKTKNNNTAAELMTTLYDASLDKLNQHYWKTPNRDGYHVDVRSSWNYTLTGQEMAGANVESPKLVDSIEAISTELSGPVSLLQGKAAGISISSSEGLNEVIVNGYNSVRQSARSNVSSIMIRGAANFGDYKQPLIVLDGTIYTGNLNDISTASITQAIVLKGADASALFGSQGAAGVLVLSTKGPIVLPGGEEPVIKVRKNFNETAFFYPDIHAGKDGYFSFIFTMPESATEWNWKMLAHDKGGKFAYLEKKLQTQLKLMVQPNVPRLLYQGDEIKLQVRVSNLDTTAITGKVNCKIEDALTGEDITGNFIEKDFRPFNIAAKTNGNVSFVASVPREQVNPIKIIVSAKSGTIADAEEHIIPILSPRILVKQSQPIRFVGQQTQAIGPVKLPAGAALYGATVSIPQKPQAALLYALPWLANYSYNCAEQTFNKLRAQVTGLLLMRTDSSVQKAFKMASATTNPDKTVKDSLPGDMAEAAMPCLRLSNQTANRQKQLYNLLDSNRSAAAIYKHMNRLYELQQSDGGLSWFDGGKSNWYISAYVLAGFGQLNDKLQINPNYRDREKRFIDSLVSYQQHYIMNIPIQDANMFGVYALSYWTKQYSSAQLQQKIELILNRGWTMVNNLPLQQQAILIISTLRFTTTSNPLNKKALQLLESIRQLAVVDDANGMRWKDIADNENLGSSAEETLALLTEAFVQAGRQNEVYAGVVKWLLTTKQDEHWQTTKATAAAIDMLQKDQGTSFGKTNAITGNIGAQPFSVNDDMLSGIPSAFIPVKQIPEKITLQASNTTATGTLTWHYFASPANLDTLNKTVKLVKKFFVYDDKNNLTLLSPKTILKTGDRVQVQLTVETDKHLTFVHISDPRAAAFEPKETSSGYQYQGGLSYYQSIRDTGLELFTEDIPRGTTVLTYNLVAANEGVFTSGPAQLQCMYQPALAAYSGIETIMSTVKDIVK